MKYVFMFVLVIKNVEKDPKKRRERDIFDKIYDM